MILASFSVAILLASGVVTAGPDRPWFASIQRSRDCTSQHELDSKPLDITLSNGDVSEEEIPFPYTREDAFTILLNACEFARAAGSERLPTLQVELANVLWHQPDRVAIFDDLYGRGNLPGKLHALV